MKRVLLLILGFLCVVAGLQLPPGKIQAASQPHKRSEKVRLKMGLEKLKAGSAVAVKPTMHSLDQPILIGPKIREELIESRRSGSILAQSIQPQLPPVPKDVPGREVVITTDFQSQGNSGGAVIALRDSNNNGQADQETVMADQVVEQGDGITKIVASQLFFGRYFAITENAELIQIDDINKDYIADDVVAYGDFRSSIGLGIGIATAVIDDGSEAIYLLRIEPGPDRFFYTADDTASMAAYLDRNRNGEIDTISQFLTTRNGFTSLGGFAVGVETSLLFNLGQYDNAGRVTGGAIYSYYDFDGNGVPENFSTNNSGIFADVRSGDRRPAVATDIVQVGTDFYVSAPLAALGLASGDDIAIYSDINASQVADSSPLIFAPLPSLSGFSSDLGGLAVSLDGTRVATARNLVSRGNVQDSNLLILADENFNLRADGPARELFDNGVRGIGGVCFSNVELLGPQPIIVFPRLKSVGKFVLDAIGARIEPGATLIVDNKESFSMRLNNTGTKWLITPSTRSTPSGLSITQAVGVGTHTLVIKNQSGQLSLPVLFRR
ncbi:MAG: hypothetical protein AB1489_00540 [Acidobacteriota bacterium]